MTQPQSFKRKHAPRHVAARSPRWWQFLRRHRLTDTKAKEALQAENRISLGKAFWDVPIRLGAGLATMAAAFALVKYAGAIPVGALTVAQHLDAIVAQIPGIPGGQVVAEALDYVKGAGQATVAAVAASYAGDRYKSGRKARLEQARNEKAARELQELRERGIDVDTSPYEQVHTLKAENRELKDQVAELQQWKAKVERQLAGHDQGFRDAYAAHVTTNNRIDELSSQTSSADRTGFAAHDPQDPDGGMANGPKPPPPSPPGAAPQSNELLSMEDSSRTRALLDRAKRTNTQENRSRAEQNAGQRATGRHRGLPPTPVQEPTKAGQPRR